MRRNALVRVRHRNAVRRERLDLRRVPCSIVPCTAWPLGPLGWFALAWDGHRLPHISTIVNIFFAKMCRKFLLLLLQQFLRRLPCMCRPVPPWHDPPFAALRRVIFCANMTRGIVYTLTAADVTSTGAVITFQSVSLFCSLTTNPHKYRAFTRSDNQRSKSSDVIHHCAFYIT